MSDTMDRLLDGLYDKSINQEIGWKVTPDKLSFKLTLADYTVLVSRTLRGAYRLDLLDSNGDTIDSSVTSEGGRLQRLWDSARRKALNLDAIVDDVLKELDKGD